MSALSSSSSPFYQRKFKYDIFLSFCGTDTRKNFTDYLYSALTREGIETFRDDKSLERGEDFAPELFRAIEESWGSIIVFSQGYAFSHWCLDELVEIMKQREERELRVYPIFYYVEPSDFRHQINIVKEAFDKHERRYNKEKTQRWRRALIDVTGINGWPLKDQHESIFMEGIVKDISQRLDAEISDVQEVEKMKTTFRTIQAMLVDAENKQYMKGGEAVKVWFDKLKLIAYDIEDVLDEWNTAILKSKIDERNEAQTPSTSSSLLRKVHNIPSTFFPRIKDLDKKLESLVRERDFSFTVDVNSSIADLKLERTKTTSLIDESDHVYGRDHDKHALVDRLLLSVNNDEGGSKGISLIAIVGMGGLGKTTLAQLAFNSNEVKKHFPLRIWVSVSDPFDEVRIAKAILETLKGSPSSFNELESLLQEIRQHIEGKKFLLVLDDVWNEDEKKWKPLKLSLSCGSQGSKILVTTRKEKVTSIMGCTRPLISLRLLSAEDSWSLFSEIAFFERSDENRGNLDCIGRKIVEKCAGLPLAIKIVASLLRFKMSREQWQGILDSHMWEIDDDAEKGLFSPLLLSYYDLPASLRQCFSYCAIFPKDHDIEKDLLIKLWMAQGYLGEMQGNKMEIVGEDYFDKLAARSFFQEFKKDENDDSIIKYCKMHDIVHDFAQLLRKAECSLVLASNAVEEPRVEFHDENVRHLTVIFENDHVKIPNPTYNLKKLRSLILVDSISYYQSTDLELYLIKLFDQLTSLRMINLSRVQMTSNPIRVLPQKIGKLIHLRYLSLEGNVKLLELPEAVCDLCNLQTLNIKMCYNLKELPRGMKKLINLRHLQNERTDRIALMPKGMEKLTSLQTLEEFALNKRRSIRSETSSSDSCSLADLGKLIHLRGHLSIRGLGNVVESSEAKEARLSTRAGLRELTLSFDGGNDKEQQKRIEDEALLLQALFPLPPHLQILNIRLCKGPVFPSWMTSLTSLKRITLNECDNWESLPPLGKLPSLESLIIWDMKKVKKVGEEFLGVGVETSSLNHNIAYFPSLKELQFYGMYKWEEWGYEYEKVALRGRRGMYPKSKRSRGGGYHSYSSSNIPIIMPKLECLRIWKCPALKTLPHHLLQSRALQQLELLTGSPFLERRFDKETGDLWPLISHIPAVEIK